MQKVKKIVFENGSMYALISKVLVDPDTGEEHIISNHHASIDPTNSAQVVEFGMVDGQPIAPSMTVEEIFGQATTQAIAAKMAAEEARDIAIAERDEAKKYK